MTAADKRYAWRFAVLGAVFLAVLLGSLLVGRYALSPGQLVHMLWTRISGGAADWPISDDKVVFAVRLPRVAAAALVGAALAVSGAAYQGMFRIVPPSCASIRHLPSHKIRITGSFCRIRCQGFLLQTAPYWILPAALPPWTGSQVQMLLHLRYLLRLRFQPE